MLAVAFPKVAIFSIIVVAIVVFTGYSLFYYFSGGSRRRLMGDVRELNGLGSQGSPLYGYLCDRLNKASVPPFLWKLAIMAALVRCAHRVHGFGWEFYVVGGLAVVGVLLLLYFILQACYINAEHRKMQEIISLDAKFPEYLEEEFESVRANRIYLTNYFSRDFYKTGFIYAVLISAFIMVL